MPRNKSRLKQPYFSPTAKTQYQPIDRSKKNADAIISKITERFADRSRKDIRKWRTALAAAKHPQKPRYDLYFDLVDDLKTDGKLQSQMILRKTATLAMNFHVKNKKTGEINELATDLLRQRWFYKLVEDIIEATVFGVQVIEFQSFDSLHIKFEKIPQTNIVAPLHRIYPDLYKDAYIDYKEDIHKPWILDIAEDDPLGLINNVIPNLIWKRNVAQSWAEFCEKFGMPLVSATTNNASTDHIDKVQQQLLSLAEASVGVFPEGTTIKFDEANRTDAYQVYQRFIDMNTSEISSLIVGSNTLSDDATNRAQTEVHERSLDDKISASDRREISFIVNDELLPLIKLHGYDFLSDDDSFEFIPPKGKIDLLQYWSITQGLMQQYEVDQDWLSETFDIPIIGKRKMPLFGVGNSEEASHHPNVFAHIKPAYNIPEYAKKKRSKSPTSAASNGKLDQLQAELTRLIYENKDSLGTQGKIIVEEAGHLIEGLKKGFGVTAGWNTPDNLAYQLMEYNLFEFAEGKTEARLATMMDLLHDKEKNQIRSFNDFKTKVEEQTKEFNRSWLETEYNLSIAVGQTSAAYHRFMAEKDDVTHLVQYQTVEDDKVRTEHDLLNGRVFDLNDASAMDLWPPNGYNCRCEFIQYLGDKSKVTSGNEGKALITQENPKWIDSQFNINRGNLKQVFTKKQFYHDIKGLPERLNQMDYTKYKLPEWDSFKSSLKDIVLDQTITADNVKELFKTVGEERFMRFTDYSGRKITMPQNVFNIHTEGHYTNDYEQRHQLFPHIKEVLKNPDEVWFYKYKIQGKNFQSRYLKFYKNDVIIVDTEIKSEQGLEIKTWYKLKEEETKKRVGLKIK